jgi:hypothetical protein
MVIGVNADITANVKSWVQGMREAFDSAATLGKGVHQLEKDVKEFVRDERGEGRMGSFISGELQKLLPLSKEASSALGSVAAGFMVGGGIATAGMKLLEVGVEALTEHFREAAKMAEELDKKRLEGLTASVDKLKEGAQSAKDKLAELMGVDPQADAMLRQIAAARVAFVTYKQSLEDSTGATDGFGNTVKLTAEELVAQGIASADQVKQFNKLQAGARDAETAYAEYKKTMADVKGAEAAERLSEEHFARWKKRQDQLVEVDRLVTEASKQGLDARGKAYADYAATLKHIDQLTELDQYERQRARTAAYAAYHRELTKIALEETRQRDELVAKIEKAALDAQLQLVDKTATDEATIWALEKAEEIQITQEANAAMERLAVGQSEAMFKIQDASAKRIRALRLKTALELFNREAELGEKGAKDRVAIDKAAYDEMAANVRPYVSIVGGAMQGLINGIIAGNVDMAGTIKGVFSGLVNALIGELDKWIVKKIAAALVEVEANAASAGSETAKQTASIPFVGPFAAVAAGLAMSAAIMGAFAIATNSASGGYDIPAGVNPLVQAHAREMFLPEKYADVIRGLAGDDSRGGGMGGDTYIINLSTIDGESTQRYVESQRFRRAVREARRNGRG